ncbi:MAG: carboxyltransferase domain-containing protein, partial [Ilumatobacter fluminis]
DGDDLAEVAERSGLSTADVIERHAGATFRVAFCGFSPGFAYLDGLPPELHLARRATPRTRVPAGSVAIAAGFSAVYPTASPGGWHLIGRTDVVLFDVRAEPPARLTPGTSVRFVPR